MSETPDKESNKLELHWKLCGQCFRSLKSVILNLKLFLFFAFLISVLEASINIPLKILKLKFYALS